MSYPRAGERGTSLGQYSWMMCRDLLSFEFECEDARFPLEVGNALRPAADHRSS